MRKKQKEVALPRGGDAFLMPLKDGRFSVCRVLRRSDSDEEKNGPEASVLVAGSVWIGVEAPDIDDLRLREILMLAPHALGPQRSMHWVSDPVPANFITLLRRCIVRLNELNEQHGNFIETVEREDLCAEFDEIVYACGLHECSDLADRWRDW